MTIAATSEGYPVDDQTARIIRDVATVTARQESLAASQERLAHELGKLADNVSASANCLQKVAAQLGEMQSGRKWRRNLAVALIAASGAAMAKAAEWLLGRVG